MGQIFQVDRILKDEFNKKIKISHYLLTLMSMEGGVELAGAAQFVRQGLKFGKNCIYTPDV